MFFPWLGQFEQAALADAFVFLDDAQLSKGSFVPRVQVRTEGGSKWLTTPVVRRFGQKICEARLQTTRDWRRSHVDLLRQAYARAPFVEEMMSIVQQVYERGNDYLADLNIEAFETVGTYLGIEVDYMRASALDVSGTGSGRVLDIVRHLGGTTYVTGHGARDYLDHEAFDAAGVAVEYIDYRREPYPQVHGGFDPYVSVLDAIANLGPDARSQVCSQAVPWRQWLARHGDGSPTT